MIRWTRSVAVASLGLVVSCGGMPDGADGVEKGLVDETAATEQAVGGNGNHPELVKTEAVVPNAGRYPEVMYFSGGLGCTGTVIGPYSVLTASHCMKPDGRGWIGWGSTWLEVTASWVNPYRDNPYRPAWWTTLNSQRTDGRTDDWPAMHDQLVVLVPGLTPAFIAQHKILPARIAPSTPFGRYMLVGVGSTDGSLRQFIRTQWRNTTPGTITSSPKDGYLNRDGTTVGFGFTQGGDSGGPSIGSQFSYWWSQNETMNELDGEHVVVGVTQSGLAETLPDGGPNPWYNIGSDTDASPLAYTLSMTGSVMSTNQQETVRLNHLWARAMREDPDGDGIPMACDSDSTNGTGSANWCPPPVGMPKTGTKTKPVGLLECNPGSLAVGIRGRAGAVIDRLSLLCKPLSCFYRNEPCTPTIDSDAFGWSGGGWFADQVCPAGQIMTALETSVNGSQPSAWLSSIRIGCSALASPIVVPTYVSSVAGTVGPVVQRSVCGEYQSIAAIEVRAEQAWALSGLQVVCDSNPRAYSAYTGGYASSSTSGLRCPLGSVAVGTVQKSGGWVVDHFGIVCAPSAKIAANQVISGSDLFVAHARYYDTTRATWFPPRVVPLPVYTASGTGASTSLCGTSNANGWRALKGLRLRAGDLVDRIEALQCAPLEAQNVNEVAVGVGGTGGGAVTISCPVASVNGFFAREQERLAGVALHCGR